MQDAALNAAVFCVEHSLGWLQVGCYMLVVFCRRLK